MIRTIPYSTRKEYSVHFYDDTIKTVITNDPHKVSEWISITEATHNRPPYTLIVGLAVEWCPNNNNRFHNNPVAILQLSVDRRCLIFQLLYCPKEDFPPELFRFLVNPSYLFVGVGVHAAVERLERYYGMRFDCIGDLGLMAANESGKDGDRALENADLKGLARVVLGKQVDKPREVTLSTWDQERLTPRQVHYACLDVYLSFEIGSALQASFNSYFV